jgi:hypothetical protein
MKLRVLHKVAPGLFVATVLVLPGVATAQEAPFVATVTTREPAPQATRPNWAAVWSGVGIFALSYVPAAVVGAESGLSADRALFVPLAGPWIDFTQRGGCGPGVPCNSELTDEWLLLADGVLQAAGAITLVVGFLTKSHKTTTPRSGLGPTVHVSPGRLGTAGYGMVASGTF